MSRLLSGPRRILLTTDAVGGVWTYSLELCRALARRDVAVALAVLGPRPGRAQENEARQIPGLTLHMLDLPLEWTAGSESELRAASRTLEGFCADEDFDLVHLHNAGLACEGGWKTPLVVGVHSCVATWWRAVRGGGELPADLRWQAGCIRDGLARARLIITPSRAQASAVAETYDVQTPVRIVHNGRTTPTLVKGDGKGVVLAAGRLWDEAKNVRALDAAAALTPITIHAAGPTAAPGGAPVAFPHLVPLGLLGSGELWEWFARASLFVTTAVYEPFGYGVLEAAKARCALLLADIPTFRELWDGAASFVDPRDPAAIASEIGALCSDHRRRVELSERAYERALRYSPERMGSETLEAYAAAAGIVESREGAA